MAFWIGILAGSLFVCYTLKIGFYETWAMLFNLVISIYLGVHLQPIISRIIPAAADTPYGNALTVLAVAAGSFLILHGITCVFFTSQLTISFPKIFDVLGTGLLGFLAGFLVWSFVTLLISITPISQQPIAKEIGFGSQFEQTNVPYICRWCNLVSMVVSRQDKEITSEQVISGLLKSQTKKAPAKMAKPAESDKPAEPNDAKESIGEEEQP